MNKLKYYNLKMISLILMSLLALSSCASTSTSYNDDEEAGNNLNVKFTTLAQQSFSNISLPRQLVIKSTKDWLRLLKIHGNTQGLNKSNINVDFYENIVIAIFAGQQPSGGYTVGVSNIKRIDGDLYVTLTFKEPGKNEDVSLALTQPYIMISTEKIDGKIIFLASPSAVKKY